jgi:uncharacterized SAM-binding protein YcdF (DUF218 family)
MTYTEPLLSLVLLTGLAGLVRLRRGKGKRLILASLVLLALISWPPFDWLLSLPLEGRYPIRPLPRTPAPEAIVVQPAAVSPPIFERPYPLPDHQTYQRCEFAAWLHKQWPSALVLATGGGPATDAMREHLRRAGVPDERIRMERVSLTTYWSAFYSARILRERGIRRMALVVDAQSMPRAAACFRKQGFEVIPAPSEIRAPGEPWLQEILPSWKSIQRNEVLLHELLGLAWYRLRGWI